MSSRYGQGQSSSAINVITSHGDSSSSVSGHVPTSKKGKLVLLFSLAVTLVVVVPQHQRREIGGEGRSNLLDILIEAVNYYNACHGRILGHQESPASFSHHDNDDYEEMI